jgi:hypothetical protein
MAERVLMIYDNHRKTRSPFFEGGMVGQGRAGRVCEVKMRYPEGIWQVEQAG